MTGADLLRLREDLGLTDEAVALIAGMLGKEFLYGAYTEPEKELGQQKAFTQLACDILSDLWAKVEKLETSEEKAFLGRRIAEELHVHGAGFVVWWIFDERCAGWKDAGEDMEWTKPRM